MAFRWIIERYVGDKTVTEEAFGEEGYLKIVTHEDILHPGRIRGIGLEGVGPPVAFVLQPDETLVVLHRRTIELSAGGPLLGPPSTPTYIVMGVKGPHGERYAMIAPNGAIMITSDLNEV